MRIISTEIIEENGCKYTVTTYENGAVSKVIYPDPNAEPPAPEPLPELSDADEAILNTAANVEYLVALKELEVM